MITVQDVREVLGRIESMAALAPIVGEDDDLFEAGMDSFDSVQLMLRLEACSGIEFPERLFNRRAFSTIRIICENVRALHVETST